MIKITYDLHATDKYTSTPLEKPYATGLIAYSAKDIQSAVHELEKHHIEDGDDSIAIISTETIDAIVI